MKLKDFIKNFNFQNPSWENLPEGFPDCDLDGIDSNDIGSFLAVKTAWELSRPKHPTQQSRTWKDPEGYKYLFPWSNAVLLRVLGRKLTDSLPKSEYRRKSQLDDCLRSVVRNIEEGFKRSTTSEYCQFLGYSQGSLEEGKGDIKDLAQDRFLSSKPGSSLLSIGVNLKSFNTSLRSSNHPLSSSKNPLEEFKGGYRRLEELYPPLSRVRPQDLTIEIFLELINKTDYLLRILVQSLEVKLAKDQKYYQVEQAKLKAWRKP